MTTSPQSNSLSNKNLITSKAEIALLSAAKNRIVLICYVLAIAHFSFSFTSLKFIRIFEPQITLIENLVPRLIFSILPFLFLGYYLNRNTKGHSNNFKIILYVWCYAILFFVAAWIHVWPIALNGNPSILLYVTGVNSAYVCSTWSLAALPRKFLGHTIASLTIFTILPLLAISFLAGDFALMNIIASDMIFATVIGVSLGSIGAKVYRELEYLRATHRVESSKFLGETLEKAIFENKTDYLEEQLCTAYVFVFDIRGSTVLTRKYGARWAAFNKLWLEQASDTIKAHGGTFVKSTGDGLLGAFGLFDDEEIVKDLPGLEAKNSEADEERWRQLTVNTYGCLELLINRFSELAERHFPEEEILIACGLDRGEVHRGIRGGKSKQEFDIWGDKVNTAAKLESFSKLISKDFGSKSSFLIVSPFASDFLEDLLGFEKYNIAEHIQSELSGIKWVLVRNYQQKRSAIHKVG